MPQVAKYIGIGIGSLFFISLTLLIYMLKKNKKSNRYYKTIKGKKGRNKLFVLYLLYTKTPYINKYFAKVRDNTESIYPSDPVSVNQEATKIMTNTALISVMIGVGSVFLAKGDLFYSLIGIMTALVIFNYLITTKFEKKEFMLLQQLQSFLSDIRHYYMANPIIEDAVQDTLNDIPYEVSLHVQKIYDMLISPTMEEKIEEYTSTAPNRFFLLLVSICSSVKEYGDTVLSDGTSNFLTSLSYLKEEINVEILKRKLIKHSFAGLEIMSLIIVFFLKPIESWGINNMPELADFYRGTYGKAMTVGLFIISYICYYLVDVLRNSRKEEIKQKSIYEKISNLPIISPIMNKVINRNYKWALDTNDKMKEVGDQTGPKAFLVKQIIFGIVGFMLVNTMFFTTVIQQKATMVKNFIAEFDTSVVPNEKYLKNMQDASNEYANLYKKYDTKDLDTTSIQEEIVKNTTVKNKKYAEMVAESVVTQLEKYHHTYYKWYYLVISLIGFMVGFILPTAFLSFKRKTSSMNKDDEINQFQTLILILMHVDGISLDLILEWMNKFAYAFKSSIEDCIIELESGEKQALEHLKRQEEYVPFKRFVDCLLTIDESGVAAAFDEIVVDRAYSLKEREQQNQINNGKKSSKARKFAYAPIICELVFYLIAPMLVMALQMFLSMDFSI